MTHIFQKYMEKRINCVGKACLLIGIYITKRIIQRRVSKRAILRKRKIRKTWQEQWLQRRALGYGILSMVHEELHTENREMFENFLRMDDYCFQTLLKLIKADIIKKDTHLRESISADKRLAVTLRFLASGNSYRDLMFSTRIHESTISLIVPSVCHAIITRLMSTYLKMPTTAAEWKQIANDFERLWNFPFCIGALDGKHINFQAPRSSGSFYYNYKGHHSIVLLALADANCKFIYVDVGVNGRISDGGVYRESTLKQGIEKNILNLPDDDFLPGTNMKVSYVMVGDDAFPLSHKLLKPYPNRGLSIEKRIFNYRLSRARRVVENTFGILSNRFRILLNTINLSPEKVETIVLTCCILHNFIAQNSNKYIDTEHEQCNLNRLSQQGGTRATTEALNTRDKFCNYFNSVGSVEWQRQAISM